MPTNNPPDKVDQAKKSAAKIQTQPLESAGVDQASPQNIQAALANPRSAHPKTIIRLQRLVGNHGVTALLHRKVVVGPAHDSFEREADHMADQVMSMSNPQAGSVQRLGEAGVEIQAKPLVQRLPADEEEVQALPDPGAGFEAGAEVEGQLHAQKGAGSPLPAEVRDFMEPRFDADFSAVRVHSDGASAQLNRQVSAQAFTHNQDIYMGEGKYSPSSEDGKRLLAHELTHVVQQGGAQIARRPETAAQAGPAALQMDGSGTVMLQRKAILTSEEIIAGLEQVDTIKKYLVKKGPEKEDTESLLDESLETAWASEKSGEYETALGQEKSLREGKMRQGITLREHIKAVLLNYENNFQDEKADRQANAMKLAAALGTIGKAIASKLHAPYERFKITQELLKVLGPQITTFLNGGEERIEENTLAMTDTLISNDPVGLFMQNKMSLESAARLIVEMANGMKGELTRTPDELFNLLSQQYQMEMGSYSSSQVKTGQRAKVPFSEGRFEQSEAYGEISTKYFNEVAELDSGTKKPKWKEDKGGLAFTKDKGEELTKLQEKVSELAKGSGLSAFVEDKTSVLTSSQQKYLQELAAREGGEVQAKAWATLQNFFTAGLIENLQSKQPKNKHEPTELELTNARRKADEKINQCLANFANAFWVMAFKPENIFGDVNNIPTTYKHFFDLSMEEISLQEEITGSTETISRLKPSQKRGPDYGTHRYEKDLKATGFADLKPSELPRYGSVQVVSSPKDLFTIDVYGNYHIFVNKATVADRVAFAIEHGIEHKNPLLLLADMAVSQNHKNLLNGLVDNRMRTSTIEFHVLGPLNFNPTDMEKIVLANGVKVGDMKLKLAGDEQKAIEEEMKLAGETELTREELLQINLEVDNELQLDTTWWKSKKRLSRENQAARNTLLLQKVKVAKEKKFTDHFTPREATKGAEKWAPVQNLIDAAGRWGIPIENG